MAIQENPYSPPAARVEDAEIVPGNFIDGGRAVPAGHGWEWIASGWAIFRTQPLVWILMTVVMFAIMVALGFVPLLNFAAMVVIEVFLGGYMRACARSESGEEVRVGDLFSGFQDGLGSLVILGLIALGLVVAVSIVGAIAFLLFGVSIFSMQSTQVLASGFVLVFLVMLALMIPVYMAIWFGPPLVALQSMQPARAIAQSFRGCLRNIVPFLVYGVILFVLAIVASIPLGLGLLVLMPVALASTYAAYRDIFFES